MFEILEIKDKTDQSIVTVRVVTEEIHKVDGVNVPPIDRNSTYHDNLHRDRVPHSHKKSEIDTTLLIDNPATPEKIEAAVAHLQGTSLFSESNDSNEHVETYYVNDDGEDRKFFGAGALPDEVISQFEEAFPSRSLNDFLWVSTPSYNSAAGEKVITAFHKSNVDCLKHDSEIARYKTGVISHVHKFYMSTKRVGTRVYRITNEDYSCIPTWCEVLAIGEDFEEDQETPVDVGYYSLYFKGDPSRVEKAFELPKKRGVESTFYGVTVSLDGNIMRLKQYCYDYRTIFSGWELTAARVKKDMNRLQDT
jgi:hypothetical protein